TGTNTDKMFRNITERFRWGGLDRPDADKLYLDETVRRMVNTHRTAIIELANALVNEALDSIRSRTDSTSTNEEIIALINSDKFASDRLAKAVTVLDLMDEKLPEAPAPYATRMGLEIAELYNHIGDLTGNSEALDKGMKIISSELDKAAGSLVYYRSLTPGQFASLQNADKYVFYYYIPDLIRTYVTYGGDYEALEKEWAARGVNVNDMRQLLTSSSRQN
ncbi:MAG: hypothetical protein K2F71_04640, partial [Paramuribaculum sp.]|nr:hypothetical protein [Paramuribaculum sp.]